MGKLSKTIKQNSKSKSRLMIYLLQADEHPLDRIKIKNKMKMKLDMAAQDLTRYDVIAMVEGNGNSWDFVGGGAFVTQ